MRNPISRFVSGFYSRKRMGRRRNNIVWTAAEERAFADFEHANDLTESLFLPGVEGMRALGAIKAIRHTAQDQIDWFALVGEIFDVRPPIWVLRQEHLQSDFEVFRRPAGISFKLDLQRQARRAFQRLFRGSGPERNGASQFEALVFAGIRVLQDRWNLDGGEASRSGERLKNRTA